jgi:hypothetical protein
VCCGVLTDMTTGESGTASDSSNIGCTVGSFVCGANGSRVGIAMPEDPLVRQAGVLCTGTAMLEHVPVPGPCVWGAIPGTAK